jgi:hypothetical protein
MKKKKRGKIKLQLEYTSTLESAYYDRFGTRGKQVYTPPRKPSHNTQWFYNNAGVMQLRTTSTYYEEACLANTRDKNPNTYEAHPTTNGPANVY